jgi:hypothetical protein
MQRAYWFFFHIYTFLDSDFSTLIENRNNFQFWQDVCVKSWLFPFNNFMSWRRLCLFFLFIGTNIIIPYSFFVCKTVGWVDIGHHLESLRSQPRLGWPLWHICVTNDHEYVPRTWDHLTKNTNPETFWNNFDNILFNTNPNLTPDPNPNPNTNPNPNPNTNPNPIRTRFGFP